MKKTDNKTPSIGVKFEEDVYMRMDAIAKREGVALTSVVRRMVDLGLRAMDEKVGKR